jgi:polyphosphate glucokinase
MSEVLDKRPHASPHADSGTRSQRRRKRRPHQEESAPAPDGVGAAEAAAEAPVAEAPALPEPPFTLAIDIGGTGIKAMLLDKQGKPSGKRSRIETPRPATPDAVLAVIRSLLPDLPYDRVSIGFPGVVVGGVTRTAPNLGAEWHGYDLQQAVQALTSRPTRVLNDAGLQGLGVISGQGVEIVLTLGTGMGCAIFVDGRYVPNVELAHHPLRKGRTYEDYIGNAARQEVGNRKWSKRVLKVIAQVQATFNPTILYLGGGNATKLKWKKQPPADVRLVENVAGILGGIALWR